MQKKENNCSITCEGITVSWTPDLADLLKVAVFLNSLDMTNKQSDPSVMPPPYDIVEEGYKPATRKEAVCVQWEHLKCQRCGKIISSKVPKNTVVRTFLECPECVEKDLMKEEQEKKEMGSLKCSRCGQISIKNLSKGTQVVMQYIVCPKCVKKEEQEKGTWNLKCSRCRKIISSNVPKEIGTIRAYIECPECVAEDVKKLEGLNNCIEQRKNDKWSSF